MIHPLGPLAGWMAAYFDAHSRAGGSAGAPSAPVPASPSAPPAPVGEMTSHRVATDFGARDYLLFTPPRPAARPAVVLMLHGCGQDAAEFARGTRMNDHAARVGAHVIWAEQSSSANGMRCWNWHEPDHQTPDRGEAALLMALIRHVTTEAGLRKPDLFVAGMSAGGAMSAVLAELYAGQIRAIGVHSGLPFAAASSVSEALAVMRNGADAARNSGVPMILFHGDRDEVVSPVNGDALAAHISGRTSHGGRNGQHRWTRRQGPAGEYWVVHGMGHDWSGGAAEVAHTDPRGPDASAEMMRFFWQHRAP